MFLVGQYEDSVCKGQLNAGHSEEVNQKIRKIYLNTNIQKFVKKLNRKLMDFNNCKVLKNI